MWYLNYCLRETGANVFDYRALSAVALVTSALSMLCVGLFSLIYVNLHKVVQSFEKEITMSLYVAAGLSEDEILTLEQIILSYSEVIQAEFISHRDAVEAYLEQHPDDEALVASLGEHALPASFVIHLAPPHRTIERIAALAKSMKSVAGVDDVQYGPEWIQAVWWGNRLLVLIGMVSGATLALASIAIVANTIRLTLLNRKHDIEILRLLGATEEFIRGPFLLEGLILGVFGAGLSLVLLKIIFEMFVYHVANELIQEHALAFLSFPALVGVVIGGASLGLIGAMLSVKQTRGAWV